MPTILLRTLLSVCVLGGVLAACNPNSLTGSESDNFSLAFNQFTAIQQQNYLLLQYSEGSTITCKASVNTDPNALGQTLTNNSTISDGAFNTNVTFVRVATDGLTYPALRSGAITFSTYNFVVGGKVAGSFNTLFVDGDTLDGDFSGIVQAGTN